MLATRRSDAAGVQAAMDYNEIVNACIAEGASRAVAEERATEILFGGASEEGLMRKELNDIDEALWQSCQRLSFEDRCAQLEALDGGPEVMLQRATDLLESGLVSEPQFEELVARAWKVDETRKAAGSSIDQEDLQQQAATASIRCAR